MTCAGLLGLAVGHGVAAPKPGDKPQAKEGVDDEQIKLGFKYLGEHLGKPRAAEAKSQDKGIGLYFMWSVERVCVRYNLRTIGYKDWYAWGSEIIIDKQKPDDSWL